MWPSPMDHIVDCSQARDNMNMRDRNEHQESRIPRKRLCKRQVMHCAAADI